METNQNARQKITLIFFPQSHGGKILLYSTFAFQTLRYVFRAFKLSDGTYTADPSMSSLVGMPIDIFSFAIGFLIPMWIIRSILVGLRIIKPSDTAKEPPSRSV